MDFKEQLKNEVKLQIKEERELERELKRDLRRIRKWKKKNKDRHGAKDWNKIENYLEDLLTKYVKESKVEPIGIFGAMYVEISIDAIFNPIDAHGKLIAEDGSDLKIYLEDVKKFCAINGLKLKYRNGREYHYSVTRYAEHAETYLFRVK